MLPNCPYCKRSRNVYTCTRIEREFSRETGDQLACTEDEDGAKVLHCVACDCEREDLLLRDGHVVVK